MKLRVGDITMHVVEAGAGEPLVLIMGLGGDHTVWGLQMPVFAERHRVIAFDNRGAGQTDQPAPPYTTRGMAEDTLGLMDALGIERAHVCGASLGGMIAQELALNHPERVRSLQLHCTLARPDAYLLALGQTWLEMRGALSREAFTRAMTLWLFAPVTFATRPEFVEGVVQNALANPFPPTPAGFAGQAQAVAGHDTLDRLERIRCPTLITVGAEDNLVPVRFSRALHARLPHAELVVLEGGGHGHFLELAPAFNEVVLGFLGRNGGAGPSGSRVTAPTSAPRRRPPTAG
jgi:pimeloyl-ACP methyl ester carboxylesterase